jgi:CRP-like cAMP-binding protein
MKKVTAREAWTGVANCRDCAIRRSVLFAGLEEADFDAIHRPIDLLTYSPGTEIYGQDDSAGSILTIRSGLVKLTQHLPDGTQRIVRLLGATDVIGLEALAADHYAHAAVALHATEVCRIPRDVVLELSERRPALHQAIIGRWHKALGDADRWIAEFNKGTARRRVARLLLWVAERSDGEHCQLFGREDLGAVLGITTETVSRVMAELKRQGCISEPRPNQFLCDTPTLRALA